MLSSETDTTRIQLLNQLSKIYITNQLVDSSRKYVNQSLKLAWRVKYYKGLSDALSIKSRIYYFDEKFELSHSTAKLNLVLSKRVHYSAGIAQSYLRLSQYEVNKANYEEGLKLALYGLRYSRKIADYELLSALNTNLSNISSLMGNHSQAIKYGKDALRFIKKTTDKNGVAIYSINLANKYAIAKNFDAALKYYVIGKQIFFRENQQKYYSFALNNLSTFYKDAGDFDQAERYAFDALIYIDSSINQTILKATIYTNLGQIFYSKNEIKKSQAYSTKAINVIANYPIGNEIKLRNYKTLSDLSLLKGDYKLAYQYSKLHRELEKDFENKNNQKILQQSIDRYKIRLQQDEIDLLKLKKANYEAELKIIKNRDITFILILMIILILSFFGFQKIYRTKKQRQKNLFTKLLLESHENERKRLAKELHDGIGQNLLVIKNYDFKNNELIDLTIEEVRAIAQNLHPVQIEKIGIKSAIINIIRQSQRISAIFFSYDFDFEEKNLNSEIQINMYRIIQESISNILKHSGATAAKIKIIENVNSLYLEIIDNGAGFNVLDKMKGNTLGLNSILERASFLNAKSAINSKPGETKIEITFKNAKN